MATTTKKARAASRARAVTGLAALLFSSAAVAGSFSVSPVRIYMGARDRATAVTLVNEGDTDLVMQAELFEWRQGPDGADKLTATDDLILAPPILKLAAKSRQVVRLAYLRPPPRGEQLTYRMIMREVPEALSQPKGVAVQVALAFSLPVFITPPNAHRKLECHALSSTPSLVVTTCENTGQAYAEPVAMELTAANGDVLASREFNAAYILPNVTRKFELASKDRPFPAGPAKLSVTQDDGSKQVFDVELAQ